MSIHERVTMPTAEAIAHILFTYCWAAVDQTQAYTYGVKIAHMLLLGRGRSHLLEAMRLWRDVELRQAQKPRSDALVLDEIEEYGWL